MDAALVIPPAALGLAQLLLTGALVWWAVRVGRARGGAWRLLVGLPILGLVAGGLGVGATVIALLGAFHAVEAADPAVKASLLADGIAGAMRFTAAGVGLSVLAYAGAAAGCLAGSIRGRSG